MRLDTLLDPRRFRAERLAELPMAALEQLLADHRTRLAMIEHGAWRHLGPKWRAEIGAIESELRRRARAAPLPPLPLFRWAGFET